AAGKRYDYTELSVHDNASIFKAYIREIMNGIISVQIAERVMKIIKNQTDPSIIEYIVPLIIFSITNENRKMLMYLQKIFRKVDQYSKDNKMGSDNLYKIFTPTIFPNIECYDLQSINLQIEIVKRIFESNLTEIPCFLYEEALSIKRKKFIFTINQHAISLIKYHIGVLRLELSDFSKLDNAVRVVLVKNKIHLRLGCKERLYLPRAELGRGLHSVELRSEHMLLQLLDCLEKTAILKVENNNKTHLALIKGFLKVKYRLVEEVTKKSLEEAQLAKLYNEIEKRKLHSKLYNARKNEFASVSQSSRWLKEENIRPRDEVVFCYIQDSNVFWGVDDVCLNCNQSGKTLDHLARNVEEGLYKTPLSDIKRAEML
ncbi:RhoGAP domain-containing protein, partial [Hamiltosporidium tvaerminnensis]